MILTDYYMGQKLKENKAQYRYEITRSTMGYYLFQNIFENKRNPNQGGWSFNYVPRPVKWEGEEKADMAITRKVNISSVIIPDPELPFGYGDINLTNDACLFIFNNDFLYKGITEIEVFIARGQKHNKKNLWYELVDGELDHELESLRSLSVKIELNFV